MEAPHSLVEEEELHSDVAVEEPHFVKELHLEEELLVLVLGAEGPIEDLDVAPHALHVVVEEAFTLEVVEAPHDVVVDDEEVFALDGGVVVEAQARHIQRVHYGGALEVVHVKEANVDGTLNVVVLVDGAHEVHGA